ncbi:cation transporter [Paracoccus sp. S1E-3]|uniref:cation transporter n=1 Tax=Paracoccus sp. S1E-3 TaxID=2756130 RepID=UPI0015EF439B|nr:cation transporter [Paracoccus sp. S1E-3]MBA4492667.1 cation transporter [Paracoccus sp. S1E-3]
MAESRAEYQAIEARSLIVAMWGNLFMAACGVVAGFLSNSNAIIMDGLFSMVGFVSLFLARRISRRVGAGPDRQRPFGYAADEAIFVTFRALSVLGLILAASTSAFQRIYSYALGTMPPPLNFGIMPYYYAIITATCFGLWWMHRRAWIRTGRSSDMLNLESRAAAFDGAITVASGIGLAAIYFFGKGPLAPIAPVGDSIIVLLLCLFAVGGYFREVRGGLEELAGVTASPDSVALARRALRRAIAEDGGRLIDLSITKIGRSHVVMVYYDPGRPLSAAEIDRLNLRMQGDLHQSLPGAEVTLLVTEHPRRWPDELWPA